MTELSHVLIPGGGFGGLFAARALANAPARITLLGVAVSPIVKSTLNQI